MFSQGIYYTRSLNDFVGASSCTSGSGDSLTAGSGEANTCGGSFAVCFFFFRIPEGTSSSTFLLFTEDIVAEYVLVVRGKVQASSGF